MAEVSSRPHDRGRPRQFDEQQALKDAITVFRQYGYEAAGTDRLAHAMGMKKQSIYRTFGLTDALTPTTRTSHTRSRPHFGTDRALRRP